MLEKIHATTVAIHELPGFLSGTGSQLQRLRRSGRQRGQCPAGRAVIRLLAAGEVGGFAVLFAGFVVLLADFIPTLTLA